VYQNNESSDMPTVLVVDDEREAADLFYQFLCSDYEVLTAYNGGEALEKIGPEVDVVLLDRRMPDIHGDEVLAEIRNQDNDCRVVMVTAVEPSLDVISMEFDDYLVKPVDKETVVNAVDRMITRNALDANLLEAFALATKMATLEAKMSPEKLESSEEYAELLSQFEDFKALVKGIDPADSLYAELSAMKMEALFTDE